jgi:hypothetical protein
VPIVGLKCSLTLFDHSHRTSRKIVMAVDTLKFSKYRLLVLAPEAYIRPNRPNILYKCLVFTLYNYTKLLIIT